jgi:hypothetical protein
MIRLYLVPSLASKPARDEQRSAKVIELSVRRAERARLSPPAQPPRRPEAA